MSKEKLLPCPVVGMYLNTPVTQRTLDSIRCCRHRRRPADKSEGEHTGQPDCKCNICMYEAGKNIGNIITEERANKIIIALRSQLEEAKAETAKAKKRIKTLEGMLSDYDCFPHTGMEV